MTKSKIYENVLSPLQIQGYLPIQKTKHSCKYVCTIHNTEKLKNKEIIFEIGLLHMVFVIHSTTLLSYYNIVHICITTVPLGTLL